MFFHVEQIPKNFFLRVVRTGGITGRRADAAIFFSDQIRSRQLFQVAKTPFVADALVQKFRKRLRQTVGDGLGQDGVVIVVPGFEVFDNFLQANAGRDCKGT